jgi:hypothetical protein
VDPVRRGHRGEVGEAREVGGQDAGGDHRRVDHKGEV